MPETRVRLTEEELAKAHDGLCPESVGDGECRCLVHWVRILQKEADEAQKKLKFIRQTLDVNFRALADLDTYTNMVETALTIFGEQGKPG